MSRSLVLHRSEKSVLEREQPWEQGSLMVQVGVVPDPDGERLRLYYVILFRDDPARNVLCLSYSKDGYEWEKPDLGDGTNIVMRATGNKTEWGVFLPKTVLFDPTEGDSDRRWKLLYWERPDMTMQAGLCWAVSPDGIRWTPLLGRPVIDNANDAGSACLVNPKAAKGPRETDLHVYQQTWIYNPGLPTDRDNLKMMHRVISIWQCDPFPDRWIGPTQILAPDAEDAADLQFYGLTVFHTPTGYGGLLNCHHTGDQTMDLHLVSSRDGWMWKRELDRRPLVPLGPKGSFDCGMTMAISRPVEWKGKVFLFYNGRATLHDQQLRYPEDPAPDPVSGIGRVELDPAVLRIGEPV